ncbi:hypothetical protein AM588_10008990 [Phytophthora nicotianae]|uniref:Uncharacterized protein n=1 Tax=Phytophthora nicotianae TaxID=4792 RepID=A0A0W8DUY4_PHYNI|nr:hypothetical protein AM588_10008990 [Phytophthora nicotianae]
MAFLAFVTALVFSQEAAHAAIEEAEPGSELFEQFRPVYHFLALDNLGVFSGFAMNNAIDGKHTVFYTGVTALPISWKKEYLFGEHVMYATTSNGGSTWHKGTKPLIKQPPKGMNVTGWRDPMPFHSQSLDKHFGFDATTGSNYLLVAGGIHNEGPRIFLYHSEDYLNWEYKGFLLAQEKNTKFSRYSANWGYNFETTIYREMKDEDGELHNVMLFAAEGDPNRYPMWATGTFGAAGSDSASSDSDEGLFTPLMVGVSDRSDWYANSIYTDKHGKDVMIGWITEDNNFAEGQPRAGMVSCRCRIEGLKSKGKSFEMVAQVANFERGTQVGFTVRHSKTSGEATTIVYDDKKKMVIIDRTKSSNAKCDVFMDNDVTPVDDPFTGSDEDVDDDSDSLADSDSEADDSEADEGTYKVTRENLNFRLFVDVSTVEVFVNNRFALSARIYPCGEDSDGISLTASGKTTFEKVQVWTDPKHAWPAKRTVPTKQLHKKTRNIANTA